MLTMTLIAAMLLVSCNYNGGKKPNESINFYLSGDMYTTSFQSMGTYIELSMHEKDKKISKRYDVALEIKKLFDFYNELTDNFNLYDGVNNISYINNNVGKKIEVEKELYDLLIYAEEIKEDTIGYFDISIGHIIDVWKDLLLESKIELEDYNEALEKVDKIPVINDGILLEVINNKYFVTISLGVKIDLGALAKGYVVGLANDIMKKYGFIYYKVMGSASSVYYGENKNPQRDYYNIALSAPDDYPNSHYGIIKVKNNALTTSGDAVQSSRVNDDILVHHIISPITKKPENNYRMMTVLNDNAGYSDALTTALFSMPKEVFSKWIEDKDLMLVFLDNDFEVIKINIDEYFS